jgi:serine protein kinase
MMSYDDLFGLFSKLYDSEKETEMSLEDYLKCCARNPMAYASAAERLLAAIGEPEIVDTSHRPRLGRIFMNRSVRIYSTFADFYGMEESGSPAICATRRSTSTCQR